MGSVVNRQTEDSDVARARLRRKGVQTGSGCTPTEWKLSTAKKIGQHVHQTRSATERKADSGRPESDTNIPRVEELICSHAELALDQLTVQMLRLPKTSGPSWRPNSPDVKCIDYRIWGNV